MGDNLKQTQTLFLKSIFDTSTNTNFIKSPMAEERMAIYRNTIMENMRNSLELTYPGIWKLIGNECGNMAACIFCSEESNLPKEGCIDFWGEKFPAFLASKEEFKNLPYIEDYGLYEWLKHLSYIGHSEEAKHISELEKYNEEESNYLCFEFQKSAFLFSSKYPIDKIEEMLSNPNSQGFEMRESESFALITKNQTLWIDESYYRFIQALQIHNIAEAYNAAFQIDNEFDLALALNFLFEKELITKTYIMEEQYV